MISCISGATHATSGRGALCGAHVVRGAYDIGLRDWERIYASWGAVQSVTFLRVDEDALEIYEVRQERGRSEWGIYLDANGVIQDSDNHRTGQ